MSLNSYQPHVVFVSEDKETRKVVTGFLKHYSFSGKKQWKNEPFKDGWMGAAAFAATILKNCSRAYVVLVIDFDSRENRYERVKELLTEDLLSRTLVLGCLDEVEDLTRAGLGLREELGHKLAEECTDRTWETWQNPLLRHNLAELEAKWELFRSILLSDTAAF